MANKSVVGAYGAADFTVVCTQTQDSNSEMLGIEEARRRAFIGGSVETTRMQVRALAVFTADMVGGALVRAAVPACISSSYLTH